jgi:lambda family phage portal protein
MTTVRQRAAAAVRNDPWAAIAVARLTANIVGPAGIRPQSQHPDTDTRRAIDRLFGAWATHCDAAGRTDYAGLQAAMVRGMVEAGEAFARLRVVEHEAGATVPLAVQVIDPAQVDAQHHSDLGDGVRVRAGIEIDAAGRRRAYHIHRDPPGEPYATTYDRVRVPADDIVHVFEAAAPGQLRGLSWLAPVLLRLHDLDQYEDAQLVRQKVSALLTGLLTDPDGSAAPFDGASVGSVLDSGLEPGTLKVLPPGYDVRFSDPAQLGDEYDPFMRWQLRAVAAGLGLTYEQLTGDMSGVNYSSARVALLEFRRRVECVQAQVLIPQFCAPVWRRLVDLAVLTGALPADDAEVYAVSWVRPRWDWVDPYKDTQAEALAIRTGLRSRAEVVAERGRDVEAVDAEIAQDTARARALGLTIDTATAATATDGGPDADG